MYKCKMCVCVNTHVGIDGLDGGKTITLPTYNGEEPTSGPVVTVHR